MKNPVHLALIFIILVGSDIFIGFYGHYVGSTGGEVSVEAFVEYLTTMNYLELALVIVVALVVCVLVFLLGGG